MSLDHLLLGLLRTPASGYELKQRLDSIYSHTWNADLPQIYRTLNRMERDGWLVSSPEPSDRGPERRVYHRTPPGDSVLADWLRAPPPQETDRRPELVRVALLGEAPDPHTALETLRTLRAHAEGTLKGLQETTRQWAANDVSYPDCDDVHDFFLQLTLDARIQELQGRVAWASRCIHRIEARMRVSAELR